MKLLFIADGRSPIALNWIRHFVAQGHEVHLATLYPCQPDLPLTGLHYLPVAFSGAVETGSGKRWKSRLLRLLAPPTVRTRLRQWAVPRSLPAAAERLRALLDSIQPDLVHAMRIPYEGMLAALALEGHQEHLLISVWGNDFTLHAPRTRTLAALTRRAVHRADALHTDCRRDLQLARDWGFNERKPAIVLPGGGGVQIEVFHPPKQPVDAPVLIHPRGLRAYVRNEVIFRALGTVARRRPDIRVLCPAMQGAPQTERWVRRYGLEEQVRLLPPQSRSAMASLFRQAQIALSITTHDGTPNTLLEALACGCFPIAGDLESIREWITNGENGLLVPPNDPTALADAIMRALNDADLRARAAMINQNLIAERAAYPTVIAQAETFYRQIISRANR